MSASLTRVVTRHEMKERRLRVASAERLPGNYVRIDVEGDDLDGFVSTGPTDHAKLAVPGSDDGGRFFTPIVGGGKVSFDIHLHGSGPLSTWAESAGVGAELTVRGPRGSKGLPEGASRLVLVADASALPPLSRWLDLAPSSVPVTAIVVDTDASYFGQTDRDFVVTTAEELVGVVAGLEFDEDTYVWAAGEATSLIPLRRWLRENRRRESFHVEGYWRRGVANHDHHAPLGGEDDE